MIKRIITKSQISIAVFIAFAMMLIVVLSGCTAGQLLQDMATDYVLINIENSGGILLSESENNEQVYTYQIDAQITNGYVLDLINAKISLNVPENVEISDSGSKQSIDEKIFAIEETKSYSWIVKIPMIEEDQNIEYSISVVSDVSSAVNAYGLLFVEGRNKNDNRLDFDTDTWKFENYGEIPIPISQEDYDALLIGLDNASRQYLKDAIKVNSGGYCYGMAVTSVLVKTGRLAVSNIESNAQNLHSISKTAKAKSVIGYYWITQLFDAVQNERAQFINISTEQKLELIEEKAKNVETGASPFILSFYTQPNGQGGHAVVGYSHENGSFKWNGKTYDSRILIYDSNYPQWDEGSCLYYNEGTSEWYIPNYPNSSMITRALSDSNIMDVKNIEANAKSVNSYVTARGNDNLNIYSTDGALLGSVDGIEVQSDHNIVAYRNDGSDDILTIVLPHRSENSSYEEGYIIEAADENESVDLSIKYDNFYLSASSDDQDSVVFNPNGYIEILGEASDFELEVTANHEYASTEWYYLSVSGKEGINPKIEITVDGYILSGDKLDGIAVYAENDETANKLALKTDETQVLITQEGENLCVKADEDNDGEYETVLATGTSTPPDDPTSGGSGFSLGDWGSGFNFGSVSVDSWMIIVIAGALLLAVAVTVIVIALNSKKKKHYDEIDIPVVNLTDDSGSEINVDFEKERVDEELTEGISVLTGAMAGMNFKIADGQTVTVGKDEQLAHVVLDNTYHMVSRVHCTISYNAKFNKYFVIDCSTNGTYFENGQRLAPNTRTPVAKGTILKLADACKIKLI